LTISWCFKQYFWAWAIKWIQENSRHWINKDIPSLGQAFPYPYWTHWAFGDRPESLPRRLRWELTISWFFKQYFWAWAIKWIQENSRHWINKDIPSLGQAFPYPYWTHWAFGYRPEILPRRRLRWELTISWCFKQYFWAWAIKLMQENSCHWINKDIPSLGQAFPYPYWTHWAFSDRPESLPCRLRWELKISWSFKQYFWAWAIKWIQENSRHWFNKDIPPLGRAFPYPCWTHWAFSDGPESLPRRLRWELTISWSFKQYIWAWAIKWIQENSRHWINKDIPPLGGAFPYPYWTDWLCRDPFEEICGCLCFHSKSHFVRLKLQEL
jgi:hypothetical protein